MTGPEHAVEIELPFLQAALGRFSLVPVLVGRVDAAAQEAFAERLAMLDDGKTLFVFSSDFTHYGPRFDYTPFGPTAAARAKIRALDATAIDLLCRVDADGFREFREGEGRDDLREARARHDARAPRADRAEGEGDAPGALGVGRDARLARRQLGRLRGPRLHAGEGKRRARR